MDVKHTVETLQKFGQEIIDLFEARSILCPFHIDDGNLAQLIYLKGYRQKLYVQK